MKFMIMVFGTPGDLRAKSPEWIEAMVGFMVRLDDELARSGELVYSEVLEAGGSATLVDQYGSANDGSFNNSDAPLSRFWVVKASETRAIEIAASLAAAIDAPVEVRRCMEQYLRP